MTAAIETTFSHQREASPAHDVMAIEPARSADSRRTHSLPGANAALRVKRSLDITAGLVLGALALPAMLLIATAIRMDSPGPALFRAKRIGRHGKLFSMYKFRTMVHGADERLHEVAHLNVASGMVKIPDDPRVTRVGKWLRRYSLDELPQVYNIIAGHMSLVGPRPHDVHDIPHEGLEHEPRLGMRPGLTGLWQVSARSDPNLDSRISLDLIYVHRWSLLLDAKILARTVPVVVLGTGGTVSDNERPTTGAITPGVQPPRAADSRTGAVPSLVRNDEPAIAAPRSLDLSE